MNIGRPYSWIPGRTAIAVRSLLCSCRCHPVPVEFRPTLLRPLPAWRQCKSRPPGQRARAVPARKKRGSRRLAPSRQPVRRPAGLKPVKRRQGAQRLLRSPRTGGRTRQRSRPAGLPTAPEMISRRAPFQLPVLSLRATGLASIKPAALYRLRLAQVQPSRWRQQRRPPRTLISRAGKVRRPGNSATFLPGCCAGLRLMPYLPCP